MDSQYAIEINNISKTFRMEVADTTKDWSKSKRIPTLKINNTVLKNISFNIKKGEIVGILGRNGSGKSTLLSLIANISEPDTGYIKINGKIATILELGMGFNPEMSGRDNIYLKSEMYGISKKEIDAKIDKIIEYSGIGNYIDSPVRTYSSGMTGRLAFSVMVNVDAEIMIVDEVLSTGDASFSARALEHFKKLSKTGKTILFVSHSVGAIESMCSRALWLEGGSIVADGPAKSICSLYTNKMNEDPAIVKDLAESGVSSSQYRLAIMYRDGKGVEQSNESYIQWLQKAAEQGFAQAQVEYGDILFEKNNEENRQTAITFYESAANKGNEEARTKIAALANGTGIDNVRIQVIDIYRQLAKTGNPAMQMKYGEVLLRTAWNNNDRAEAFRWYQKSAEQGNLNAIHTLGVMCRDGIGTKRDIELSIEYFSKASEKNYLPSITALADMYYEGKITLKDEKKAFDLSLKAAQFGTAKYMYLVAQMYREGRGTNIDLKESDRWFAMYNRSPAIPYLQQANDFLKMFNISSEINPEDAMQISSDFNKLSAADTMLLYAALGKSPDNMNHAFDLISKMASEGNIDAICKMAEYYTNGIFTKQNIEEAVKWLEIGSDLGDSSCMITLGSLYRDGTLIAKNILKAKEQYVKAYNYGNTKALQLLIELYTSKYIEKDGQFNNYLESFKKVAEYGNVNAINKLTEIYMKGQCVESNLNEAKKWCTLGIIIGDKTATKNKSMIDSMINQQNHSTSANL